MLKQLLTTGTMAIAFSSFAQSGANIYPSNLTSNMYFDNYNDNTKTIEGLHFEVLTDGNNSLNSTPPFSVKIYLLVQGTSTPIFVKTMQFANGQHELSATTWNVDVDLTQTPNIASGTYRVGIYVDADEEVTEPNENDNAILFSDNINYTSGPVQKADLETTSLDYDFSSGALSNFIINFKNKGTAAAGQVKVTIKIEDVNDPNTNMSQNLTLSALAAGATAQLSANDMDINDIWFDPNNTYKLTITVDADNTVSESNESNNVYTVADAANFSTAVNVVNTPSVFIPNPATTSQLNALSSQYTSIQSMRVYSILGAEMKMEALAPGLYLINIVTTKGAEVHKIEVQ